MSCEYRILRALKDNPKGLGIRELKRKTSEKCVRLWLPKLHALEYVKYKNPNAKRGQMKPVLITHKGLTYKKFLEEIDGLEKMFIETFGVNSANDKVSILQFEKKLDLYEKLLMDIFDICLKTDPKFALRFLNITLFVVKSVLQRKRLDYKMKINFLKAIQNILK